jgi:hypothetical protein
MKPKNSRIAPPEMTHTMRRKVDVAIERWAPLILVGALFVVPVLF